MTPQLLSSSPCLSLVCFLLVILLKIQSSSSDPDICHPFECGNITAHYPFSQFGWEDSWGDTICGHPEFQLNCEVGPADGGPDHLTTMLIYGVKYIVLEIKPKAQIMRIARMLRIFDLEEVCSIFLDTIIDSQLFNYTHAYKNVTLHYDCQPTLMGKSNCQVNDVKYRNHNIQEYVPPGTCVRSVSVPVPIYLLPAPNASLSDWEKALNQGFELQWKKIGGVACENCNKSGGNCGFHISYHETICYCPHTTKPFLRERCPSNPPDQAPQAPQVFVGKKKNRSSTMLAIGIVVGGVVGSILAGFLIFCFIRKRRTTGAPTSVGTSTTTTTSQSQFTTIDIERGAKSTYLGVKVFDYTELEQATDNFHPSKELGDGGFGIVYYGVLKDGRAVAVKRLYEKNIKRVEQFMNEIGILTTLRHPNLVNLYGCTSRHSRELLLVYEYIPNGTVADHIHARNSKSSLLPWPVRLSIAVETADALFYLHSSEVVHRDIKTNNILLDNNFQVKVADFGLSRLFPTNVTHVSTAPQGTPGYVDPEYYECYQLTDRSDVYSFGVVLIELISSLPAVDTNRPRQDINLANMALNKIQNHALSELVDPSLGFEKDYAVRSTVTSVAELAFRCLQLDRDMRPAMQEVLEVLEEIQNERFGEMKAEVVDINTENAAFSKSAPPSISPDSPGNDKWMKVRTW